MYTKSGKVLESTYSHDIMDPMEKFILWDLCEISHQWDSSTSQATKVRNGSVIGPNRKPDIHIFYDGKILDWELLFGEISYGPGKSDVAQLVHINDDHKKLMKFCRFVG
nr:15025_t:CDS:2 [Entrophospora candida]